MAGGPARADWKTGILAAFGWPHSTKEDIGLGWQKLLGAVRSYADLEASLLGRVEEVIDFLTVPAARRGGRAADLISRPASILDTAAALRTVPATPGTILAATHPSAFPKDDTVAENAREHRDNQAGHAASEYHGVPANALPLTASEDRQWATLAHFGGILGCVPSLLIYLIFRTAGPSRRRSPRKPSTSACRPPSLR